MEWKTATPIDASILALDLEDAMGTLIPKPGAGRMVSRLMTARENPLNGELTLSLKLTIVTGQMTT